MASHDEVTAGQKMNDSGATTVPSKEELPSGFRLAGGAKETHGKPIYCVAWSTDLYENSAAYNADEPDDEQANGCNSEMSSSCEAPESVQNVDAKEASQGERGHSSFLRCLATCGSNQVTVYEVCTPESASSPNNDGLILRQAYVDEDENEVFYACAFGGRCLGRPFGYEPRELNSEGGMKSMPLPENAGGSLINLASKTRPRSELVDETQDFDTRKQLVQEMINLRDFDGPQLLCVAGGRGVIKVIDTVRRMLFMTLSGHGDEVYDMKFCPTNEWLLLSASKDESLRLWNVKTATCVAIFAGHDGHRNSVLSLGWHLEGGRFVSAGMDTTVKLWSIEEGTEVSDAIRLSSAPQHRSKDPSLQELDSSNHTEKFTTKYAQMPYFSSNKVHTDYIDCVQFVGDLVLSKSINNTIVLWMPNLSKTNHRGSKHAHHRLPNDLVALREFSLSMCDVWFIRFQTDLNCRMLAIGNNIGEIRLWDMGSSPKTKHFANLTHQQCCSTVRIVSFSPDGKCLVASCEDASLWKWDAV